MIRIYRYGEIPNSELFARKDIVADVAEPVRAIVQDVAQNGDAALRAYEKRFDRADLTALEVSPEEWDAAMAAVQPEFLQILQEAAANIRRYHEKQVRASYVVNEQPGVLLGQRILPIEKVGVYVPGGTAAYPSTVLMDTIPAKLAGCGQIVMVTPPAPDGSIRPAILAAARIAGVDRVFRLGGAQAIAALAYGTESVPRVDKIVGPGNAYVAEAKKQVFGRVAIDMVAGPSEILVVADSTCDPVFVAADLLSQAEHDRLATAVLVTDSAAFAQAVAGELERQIPLLPRAEIARASIDGSGKIIVAENDLKKAIEIANELAPEHLELCVDNPFDYLDQIRCAGSVFLGKNCPEALGDYFAGPNHTLPTCGTARFSSALSVDDFVKKSQFTYYTADALRAVSGKIAAFAMQEGLQAHAKSVTIRFEEDVQ